MRSSFDYYKKIESPEMYLCNPDQKFLCALKGEDRMLTPRFNDLSELSFTVPKIQGAENSYELVKAKRLIFVDNLGWFQITSVTETVEGDRRTKSVQAKSHQVCFADRGFVTEERVYMFYNPNDPTDDKYDSNDKTAIPSVAGQLYKQLGIKIALSANDVEPESDVKDWTITYISPALQFHAKSYDKMYEAADNAGNICRSFTASTDANGYDFMVNQVEQAFEVVFEFDYLHHVIKVKTLDEITKPTNIYLSFDNVINTLDIQENADDIVTVMNCNGDNLDIRSVNPMGTNYIVDFSYYKSRKGYDGTEYPWMSKELIGALDEWEAEFERWRKDDPDRIGHTKGYSKLVEELQELYTQKAQSDADIQYANLKLMDMQTARDKYSDGEDATLNGSGFITAESVAVGAKSLLERSGFHTEPFTDDINIVGHTAGPNATKVIDDEATSSYHYEFKFEDSGTSGTPRSLIEAYIDSEKAEDNATVPLYFMDEDNRSYLKLTVAAEVGVVKDENGFVSDNGTVAIRGTSFNVSSTNGVYTIVPPNGQTITATAPDYYFNYDGTRYKIAWGADSIVTVYCYYVSGFDRYTTCAETRGKDGGWYDIWADHIKNDLSPVGDSLQNNIDEIKREMEYISEQCNIEKFIQRKGQALYDELSTYWIEGNYSNNNFVTYDETTMAERIELANELMEAAKKDLAKSAHPQYELTVDAINFIKLIEFKPFTDELELGRQITVEKEDGVCYYLALMTLEYDLDKSDTFTMTFSSASKPGDTAMTFADLIKESSSVSRTVSANWSNLTDYARNKEGITDLIMAPLDRTLRAAQNDMVNQQFLVDDTGILGRKWSDDSQTTFDDEQIRIINNTLLFTDDNWETASLALGKIRYGENGETAYGLAADVLIGNLLFGSKMKISNQNGNIALDENGITVRDSQGTVHFSVTPEGDVTIYNYATSGDLDGITETLRGEIQESAAGLRTEFTTTLTEDYTSKDELGEALANYSTTTQMKSAIEQSAAGITTSVSETLKSYTTKDDLDDKLNDYSTTLQMETAIQQVADSLTAYAKKTEGDETSAFGYTLDSEQFSVWNGDQNHPVLRCDKDGIFINGNGTFNGTIYAERGTIGGFTFNDNNLSSKNGELALTPEGLVLAQRLEVGEYFKAETLQIGKISGRNDNSAYFNFEGQGKEKHHISMSATYEVKDYGSGGFFGAGYKEGVAIITATASVRLIYSKTFNITLTYINLDTQEQSKTSRTYSITVGAEQASASMNVPYRIPSGATSYQLQNVTISPGEYDEESTNVTYSILCGGDLLPVSKDNKLGSEQKKWKEIWSDNPAIQTSDIREKNSVQKLDDKYSEFFDLLEPVTYKMNNGTSGRKHTGLIANNVRTALESVGIDTKDFAGYVEWTNKDGNISCGLRYGEFIALCIQEIQCLKQRVAILDAARRIKNHI